ncbi:uncharacterized protein J3R85_006016 [Psidium guajava]|nr:uncharacterized protein J3R85_006016 [Psidium guajava]
MAYYNDKADTLAETVSTYSVEDHDNELVPFPVLPVRCSDVEDDKDAEDDCFGDICALCDDGGNLLCCEGKCVRSFHATEEAGEDSHCHSIGCSQLEVDATQTFKCENCAHDLHQCFACGKLGSSAKSSGADVFQCVSASCGHFYHPHCVAKLIHRRDEVAAEKLKLRIAVGESFTCPVHKCCVCNQIENKKERDMQFAVCRRCPKSYHRKCLPKKHQIDEEIGTPIRNHIKFPTIRANRVVAGEKRKRRALESLSPEGKGLKKKLVASKDSSKRASETQSHAKKEGEKDKKVKLSSTQDTAKTVKAKNASKKFHKDTAMPSSLEPITSFTMSEHTSPRERLYSFMTKPSEQTQPGKKVVLDSGEIRAVQPASKKPDDSLPELDADTERRLLTLMKEGASSITMGDVMGKQNVPSTHPQYLKSTVDKAITIEKVEGSVQDKLRAYLAPFIYGMNYTSGGRHFTKVDKLQEIIDFCHGANDFSCLMAKKLEERGKKCSYKICDIFTSKICLEFELRDWITVQLKEPPSGSKLIMGLNPPFGVRADLVNKFIDKALEYKPKLFFATFPPETGRLDEEKILYDLVWGDERFLSGKSFDLPGSFDVKDKQFEEQWNNKPPLLYLWSRQDWTAEHGKIAQQLGHLPTKSKRPQSNDDCNGSLDLLYPKDDRRSLYIGSPSLTSDTSMPVVRPEETKDGVDMAECQKGCSSLNDSGRESKESQFAGNSRGEANGTGTSGIEIHEKSPAKETPRNPSLKLTDGMLSFDDRSSKQRADGMQRWSRGVGLLSAQNLERPYAAHRRDNPNLSSRRSYMAGYHLRYGQPGPMTSNCGLPGSIAESSGRADMPEMRRYAPLSDELNPIRRTVEAEGTAIRGGGYLDPNGGPRFGHRGHSFGFSTGPRWP